jgi:hypothetical protein
MCRGRDTRSSCMSAMEGLGGERVVQKQKPRAGRGFDEQIFWVLRRLFNCRQGRYVVLGSVGPPSKHLPAWRRIELGLL